MCSPEARCVNISLRTTRARLGPTIFVYDMLHPFGLAAERVATFTVGLARYA